MIGLKGTRDPHYYRYTPEVEPGRMGRPYIITSLYSLYAETRVTVNVGYTSRLLHVRANHGLVNSSRTLQLHLKPPFP